MRMKWNEVKNSNNCCCCGLWRPSSPTFKICCKSAICTRDRVAGGRAWSNVSGSHSSSEKKESLDAECVVLRKWITTKLQGFLEPHAVMPREVEKIIKKKSCPLSRRWPLNEPFIYCNQDTFGWLLLTEILRSPISPYFFPTKKNSTDLQGNAKSSSVITKLITDQNAKNSWKS